MKRSLKIRLIIICAAAAIIAAGLFFFLSYYSLRPVEVCIDPGHGGYDVGAEYMDRWEKDDNLAVALLVKQELEARDIDVCLTREGDEFVSLADRCKTANRRRAKLFVSLHRNSAAQAKGVEIWIHSDEPEADAALAQSILLGLEEAGISQNRGVKAGFAREDGSNYYVNSNTNMPSCLVELGFITSREDNLLFDENLEQYARAIAQAIEEQLRGG